MLTARTEVTDPMLIFAERHLRTILAQYEAPDNGRRPTAAASSVRPSLPADPSKERIRRQPVLSGLINDYEQTA